MLPLLPDADSRVSVGGARYDDDDAPTPFALSIGCRGWLKSTLAPPLPTVQELVGVVVESSLPAAAIETNDVVDVVMPDRAAAAERSGRGSRSVTLRAMSLVFFFLFIIFFVFWRTRNGG